MVIADFAQEDQRNRASFRKRANEVLYVKIVRSTCSMKKLLSMHICVCVSRGGASWFVEMSRPKAAVALPVCHWHMVALVNVAKHDIRLGLHSNRQNQLSEENHPRMVCFMQFMCFCCSVQSTKTSRAACGIWYSRRPCCEFYSQ